MDILLPLKVLKTIEILIKKPFHSLKRNLREFAFKIVHNRAVFFVFLDNSFSYFVLRFVILQHGRAVLELLQSSLFVSVSVQFGEVDGLVVLFQYAFDFDSRVEWIRSEQAPYFMINKLIITPFVRDPHEENAVRIESFEDASIFKTTWNSVS